MSYSSPPKPLRIACALALIPLFVGCSYTLAFDLTCNTTGSLQRAPLPTATAQHTTTTTDATTHTAPSPDALPTPPTTQPHIGG